MAAPALKQSDVSSPQDEGEADSRQSKPKPRVVVQPCYPALMERLTFVSHPTADRAFTQSSLFYAMTFEAFLGLIFVLSNLDGTVRRAWPF